MKSPARVLWLMSILACSPVDGTEVAADETSDETSDEAGETVGPIPAVPIDDDSDECITESSCNQVQIEKSTPGDLFCEQAPTTTSIEDAAAAACVLESLRAGEIGPYLIHESQSWGWCGFKRRVSVLDNREVIVVEGEYEDLGGWNVVRKGKLKSPETFQQCLDAGPDGYLECLTDPVDFEDGDVDCQCEYYCEDVIQNDF